MCATLLIIGDDLRCRFAQLKPNRQLLINKVAFPQFNFDEVDAALKAGNKLVQLHELASGRAMLARNASGQYKSAKKGLKVITLQRRAI